MTMTILFKWDMMGIYIIGNLMRYDGINLE